MAGVELDGKIYTFEPPRRFVLIRTVDETGVSGTGVVCEGLLFSDGRVVLRWLGERSSVVIWDQLEHVLGVHGHNGLTKLCWLDPER